MRKIFCLVLTCALVLSGICISAGATGKRILLPDGSESSFSIGSKATGSFNISVSAYGRNQADTTFPLEVGETVRIYATYSPDTASVDFGLVDPDGVFHYFNVTGGSIDRTIEIAKRGNYRLAVRNNSGYSVQISGFVRY